MDCFIIGYPKGLMGQGRTPIWKRGSIATEPNIYPSDKPPVPILVDTATRIGMSGSPVIIRHSGIHNPNKKIDNDFTFGTVEGLFGIYSGRLGNEEFGSQLGRVWKHECITALFAKGVDGYHPSIGF